MIKGGSLRTLPRYLNSMVRRSVRVGSTTYQCGSDDFEAAELVVRSEFLKLLPSELLKRGGIRASAWLPEAEDVQKFRRSGCPCSPLKQSEVLPALRGPSGRGDAMRCAKLPHL